MIRNAVISVSDKTNLIPLATYLFKNGVNVYASGSTYKHLESIGNTEQLHRVTDLTDFPEFLNGRVKTLHPKVHGGILADRSKPQHMYELKTMEIPAIDLVVVNLYPFTSVVSSLHTESEAIENIDIGGPTLIRAAAKNHRSVYVLTNPADYDYFLKYIDTEEERDEDNLLDFRKHLATIAFNNVTQYDAAISDYFNKQDKTSNKTLIKQYNREYDLKYGLNPQQHSAAIYRPVDSKLPFTIVSGAPGYINILDAIYSWNLVKECRTALSHPTVASFKHTSPAGVGTSLVPLSDVERRSSFITPTRSLTPLATAFLRARYTDPKSSFGDFIALSDPVDIQTAELISREVSDGIIAPDYEEGTLDILRKKKGGKYLILKADPEFESDELELRQLHGVTIVQEKNNAVPTPDLFTSEKAVTHNTSVSKEEQVNLALGMLTLKYTQSNSVCLTYRGQTVGVAAGQQSRIDCVQLACKKANTWYLRQHPIPLDLKFADHTKRVDKINQIIQYIEVNRSTLGYDSIPLSLASDAFFPFRDNIDVAAKYDVRSVVQPGGSLADRDVIEACNENKMTMFMCGDRFFLH